ncbi:MAG TPA: hypothetical protein VGS98_09385 [Thermoanaerobaculia bacterium]|jgi:hypothetical protein|nr:hypothetical protein [Thermoanaerobaculia bacterium]
MMGGRKIIGDESMTKIEELEKKIEELSARELSLFREWFAAFDAEIWDRQIESDVAEGKLDRLADEAIAADKRGDSRDI